VVVVVPRNSPSVNQATALKASTLFCSEFPLYAFWEKPILSKMRSEPKSKTLPPVLPTYDIIVDLFASSAITVVLLPVAEI